ncbi:MAG TPA: PAS domain-containing protein, partial [Thermomicrobiales bacterium]
LSFNTEYDTSIRHAPGSCPLAIGQSLLDAMPAASHDAATRLLARARDEGVTIHSTAYVAAVVPDQFYDGTIQPLHLGDGTPALLITAVNVTERVRGEREREQLLRTIEQEQQYTQLVLDTAPVAIGVVRPDDLMVASANDVFETYVSELAGKPFAAGTSLLDALPGYESSEFVRQLRAAAAEDRTLSVTGYAARFPEGRYYDWTMKPLAFGNESRATLVTFVDVSERMRGEQERERLLALVEERRQFTQAIFDIVPVCLAVVDTDAMVFSAANPAFIAATPEPFHHAGVGGRSLTTVLPHTAENGFVTQLRATGRTGASFEALATPYVHPTRGVTYWNETMIPLTTRDPAAHHVLYVAADVTEEIEARQRVAAHARAAAERASQLEAVFGALTEGLILTDTQRTIVRSNAAVARVLGLDDEPLPPLATFGERFAIRDQDGVPIPQHERAAVAALHGETRTDQLRRFRNARGEECWMSVSTAPVRDETDTITGAVLTMRDVTEERRGIEERERLLREVEERRQFAQTVIDSALTGIAVCAVDPDF